MSEKGQSRRSCAASDGSARTLIPDESLAPAAERKAHTNGTKAQVMGIAALQHAGDERARRRDGSARMDRDGMSRRRGVLASIIGKVQRPVDERVDMENDDTSTASTGVVGLDDVLNGGLARGRLFLLEGSPGTGKTTIALQFLMEGARAGEKGLYIALSETEQELRASASSHGWSLDENIEIYELVPAESLLDEAQQQSLLYSSDLELGETTRRILEVIERSQPKHIVLDSLSEIRLLAQSSLRYRRQILSLKHYFTTLDATVLLLDDMTAEALDKTVHSIAHGVIRVEELAPLYGAERRRLRVVKYRGRGLRGGFHDFKIATGGVEIFPRLVAAEYRSHIVRSVLRSDNEALDQLLGGGVESGSSALVLGPAGAGKTIIVLHFIAAAIARGERCALFVFEEELGLLFRRAKGLGIDLEKFREEGTLVIEQSDAAELSPGEFANKTRKCVENGGVTVLAIDSLNGYQNAMPEEQFLVLHMHEVLQFLNRQGVTTFLTVAQHGLVGDMRGTVDITYLADTVLLLRYFETRGRVRRAISVVKKRTGAHEDTIRELRISRTGVSLGEPLVGFEGILSGVPTYVGKGDVSAEESR